MSNTDNDDLVADRRERDRRNFEQPYGGKDRRVSQRRSNVDRRSAPRIHMQD